MRIFQAEDKEARTSESVGVSSTDALNYSLMCTYRVAYFSRMSACAVRALAEVHFQNAFPNVRKAQVGIRRCSDSWALLLSDLITGPHRVPRLPWTGFVRVQPSQSCFPTPTHHFPTASPFFFCGFLSYTFTSSIISGHRATAVSTSEGIYYAAARGWYPPD